MSQKKAHTVSREITAPEMSVDEAIEAYPDQWVIMKVTEYNEYNTPIRGRVIAHGNDRSIRPTLHRIMSSPEPSEDQYYLFAANPRANSWQEFREALDSSPTSTIMCPRAS